MNDWPHQTQAVVESCDAIAEGATRIAVTSPTGGGKSRIMMRLIERFNEDGLRTSLFTNKKMLTEQISRGLTTAGVEHGMRAAGYESDIGQAVQVCSIQTEHARQGKWHRHPAQRVIVDEPTS